MILGVTFYMISFKILIFILGFSNGFGSIFSLHISGKYFHESKISLKSFMCIKFKNNFSVPSCRISSMKLVHLKLDCFIKLGGSQYISLQVLCAHLQETVELYIRNI